MTEESAAVAEGTLGPVLEMLRLIWAVDQGLQKTSKRMEASLGITGPQRFVIRLLGRFPGMTVGQLADLMMVHPSTVSGIVRRLERRGLIERRADARDGRRSFLSLTARGRARDLDTTGTVEAALRGVLAASPPHKVQYACGILSAFAGALDAAGGPGESSGRSRSRGHRGARSKRA
jgi:DNA-binding MarR family transcriptional regulator